MNQAIHSVDLLLWLMGPVESVTAKTAIRSHQRIEVEDVAVATLQFRSGALGVIEATTGSFPGLSKRIEIHGSTGSVIVEEQQIKHWAFAHSMPGDADIVRPVGFKAASQGGAGDPRSIGHEAHACQFREFIAAIERGVEPAIAGLEGCRSVALIQAIYRSARENCTVVIP
jgi:predicted dehydrogenase